MAAKESGQERRRATRVEAEIELRLASAPGAVPPFSTRSLNLSTGGVYCLVDHELPVPTRLDLSLQLPKFAAYRFPQVVECAAVVVRCEKVKPSGKQPVFDLACAFQSLDDESQGLINEFVLWKTLGMG